MILMPEPSSAHLLSEHATIEDFRQFAETRAKVQAFNISQMALAAFRKWEDGQRELAAMESAFKRSMDEFMGIK